MAFKWNSSRLRNVTRWISGFLKVPERIYQRGTRKRRAWNDSCRSSSVKLVDDSKAFAFRCALGISEFLGTRQEALGVVMLQVPKTFTRDLSFKVPRYPKSFSILREACHDESRSYSYIWPFLYVGALFLWTHLLGSSLGIYTLQKLPILLLAAVEDDPKASDAINKTLRPRLMTNYLRPTWRTAYLIYTSAENREKREPPFLFFD
jgi:hypothetical protein